MNHNLRPIVVALTIFASVLACGFPPATLTPVSVATPSHTLVPQAQTLVANSLALTAQSVSDTQSTPITRESIQNSFEELGFTFDAPNISDGQLRVQGFLQDPPMSLELTGEADNLSQVSFLTGYSTENAIEAGLTYMVLLLKIGVPNWSDGKAWLLGNLNELIEAIKKGEQTPERSLIVDNREVSLSMLDTDTGIVVVLIIKAPAPTSELTIAVKTDSYTCQPSSGEGFTITVGEPPYTPEQALVFGKGFLPTGDDGKTLSMVEFPAGWARAEPYRIDVPEEWTPSQSYIIQRVVTDFPQYGTSLALVPSNDGTFDLGFGNYFAFIWGEYEVAQGNLYIVGIYEIKDCSSLP